MRKINWRITNDDLQKFRPSFSRFENRDVNRLIMFFLLGLEKSWNILVSSQILGLFAMKEKKNKLGYEFRW